MQILALVRNFVPSHQWIRDGGWNIADCVQRSYDVEGMDVGVIAAGRIGRAVLERMKPFGVNLHYFDVHRLSPEYEKQLGVTYHPDVESLARSVDVVSIHSPLIAQTHHMFNEKLLKSMRRGSYIVNTARAEETDHKAIVAALEAASSPATPATCGSTAAATGSPVAHHAQSCDDAAHLGLQPVGAGPLLRRDPRDPRGLVRRPPHPLGIPDRRGRQVRRDRGQVVRAVGVTSEVKNDVGRWPVAVRRCTHR